MDVATGDESWHLNITGAQVGLFATTNVDVVTPVGKIKADALDTLDILHHESGIDVRGSDMFVITADLDNAGSTEIGDWYRVMGDAKDRASHGRRRGNYARHYINLTTDPRT